MPLAPNGRISLNDIKNEFGDPDGDGQFKFSEYYRGDSRPVKNIGANNNIATAGQIRASQFYSSTNIYMPQATDANNGGWPGDGIGTGRAQWDSNQLYNGINGTPEAYAVIQFTHVPSSSKVNITYSSGNSGGYGVYTTNAFNYAGLETATWEVKYDESSSSETGYNQYGAYGPRPVDDGYNSGTYYNVPTAGARQFGWLANCNSGNTSGRVIANDVSFTLRATLGSDTYTSTYAHHSSGPSDIFLRVDFSSFAGAGSGK